MAQILLGKVVGDPGAKGEKGDPGIQGVQGVQGVPGVDGSDATVTIANDLIQTVAGKVLDATQGKAINDALTTHKAESVLQGNPHGINSKANKVQPSWINATPENGWTHAYQLQYRKNDFNELEFKGIIQNGTKTAGTVLFTLPSGYRPEFPRRIQCLSYSGSTTKTQAIEILITGTVAIKYDASLDAISFDSISLVF